MQSEKEIRVMRKFVSFGSNSKVSNLFSFVSSRHCIPTSAVCHPIFNIIRWKYHSARNQSIFIDECAFASMGFAQWRIMDNDNSSHVAVCVAKWQQPTAHVHSTYNVLRARTWYMQLHHLQRTNDNGIIDIATMRSISRINGIKFVFAILQLLSSRFFHVAQRLLQFPISIKKHIQSIPCGCWTTDIDIVIDEICLLFSINRCERKKKLQKNATKKWITRMQRINRTISDSKDTSQILKSLHNFDIMRSVSKYVLGTWYRFDGCVIVQPRKTKSNEWTKRLMTKPFSSFVRLLREI